jgi:hypothetical protein
MVETAPEHDNTKKTAIVIIAGVEFLLARKYAVTQTIRKRANPRIPNAKPTLTTNTVTNRTAACR